MTLYNEKKAPKAFIEEQLIEFTPPVLDDKFKYIASIMDDYMNRNPDITNKQWWDKLDSLCSKSTQELKIYYQVFK